MPSNIPYSAFFVLVLVVVAILIAWPTFNMWRRFTKRVTEAIEKNVEPPSPVGAAVTTVLVVGGFILLSTMGWSQIATHTTNSSDYKNPAEVREQKKVQESELPSSPALDAARAEQKARQQDKPHQQAISSFDDAMAKEAEKIRQRNGLNKPTPSPEAGK
jgi:predicted PurR-regulated permease PerM